MFRHLALVAAVALAGRAFAANPVPALSLDGHTVEVYSVTYSPDGRSLASASNREVKAWDAADGKPRFTYQVKGSNVYGLAYSPDGRRIAVSASKQVYLLDATTGQEVQTFPPTGHYIFRIAFSPDGKLLTAATGTNTNNVPGEVCLLEADTGKNARTLRGHGDAAFSVAYSADGSLLASVGGATSGSRPGEVLVWAADTGRQVRSLVGHADNVYGVAFSPDARLVASCSGIKGGSEPGTTKLWELATGQPVLNLSGHRGGVFGVVVGPTGRWLATAGGDGAVKVWDAATGAELASLNRHSGAVYSLALSPDGRRLASAGTDHIVHVWDTTACIPQPPLLTGRDPKSLWADLAGRDAVRAHRCVWELAACPEQSVPLVRDRVRAAPLLSAPQRKQAGVWVRLLDDGQFQRRERATRELARLGEAAAPVLAEALAGPLAAEARRRAERLYEAATDLPSTGERLAGRRAVAVLELAGTPDARAVLQGLAGGLPEARLTADARAALGRLDHRRPHP